MANANTNHIRFTYHYEGRAHMGSPASMTYRELYNGKHAVQVDWNPGMQTFPDVHKFATKQEARACWKRLHQSLVNLGGCPAQVLPQYL